MNKVITYINFAKKSKNIIYGVDDIIKSRKIELIFISEELAESGRKKVQKFTATNNIKEFLLDKNRFFELIQNSSIKVFGITDKNLANAIKLNFTNKS